MKKKLYVVVLLLIVMALTGCVDQLQNFLPMYTLTVEIEGQGSVLPQSGKHLPGEKVELEVEAENGWRFKDWGGLNGSEVVNNNIIMNDNKSITAVFIQDTNGGGEVTENEVYVKLHLPEPVPGKNFEFYVDYDIDPGNGYEAMYKGVSGTGPVIEQSLQVQPGNYYIYAAVDANGTGFHENGPDKGDFVGIYGGSFDNWPESPNAYVPDNGSADFDLYMQVMEEDWKEENVIVRLNLPYQVDHKKFVVFADNDMDPDNGYVSEYWGETYWSDVIEAQMFVPEGNYFIYAAIDANGSGFNEEGPDVGDFLGVYGGSMDYMPEYPNAYVPHDRMEDFNIDMFIMEEDWKEDNVKVTLELPYPVLDKEYVIAIDDDANPENGVLWDYWGICDGSDIIERTISLPHGDYNIYAAVNLNDSNFDGGPLAGDLVGVFGGSIDQWPAYQNAHVPEEGFVDFGVKLQVLEEDWTEEDNVIVRLELPYPVEHKEYVIIADDDLDPENGVIAEYLGECDWTQVIEATMYLPAGQYFIYAAVDANGNGLEEIGPDIGDFVGIYGDPNDEWVDYPNAYVPEEGMVQFDIDLVIVEEWEEENVIVKLNLPYAVEGKEYVISIDNDNDPDNGVLYDYWGMTEGTDYIEEYIYLPSGEYCIYAAVNMNDSDFETGPLAGDLVGIFGGSSDEWPDYPNAYVPEEGMVGFGIEMHVIEYDWEM
ncbi:MAG: hypothetical protein KAX49_02625 [Halanaerobiales bacterium]|nr:hypothetical protein [Halanaerobiales bacterium]